MKTFLFYLFLLILTFLLLIYILAKERANGRAEERINGRAEERINGRAEKNKFLENYIQNFFNYRRLEPTLKKIFFYTFKYGGEDFMFIVSYNTTKPEESIEKFKRANPERAHVVLIDGEPNDLSKITLDDRDLVISTKKVLLPKGGHFIYFPYYAYAMLEANLNPRLLLKDPLRPTGPKNRFCYFAYSNCNHNFSGVRFREFFYQKMQEMSSGRVDNLGSCLNGSRKGSDVDNSSLTEYKFVIAIENEPIEGYISEKLTNPMFAGSIPIYYGAPDVGRHFNTKSFIHIRDFPTVEDCINFALEVDRDKDLYQSILRQPFLLGNKLNQYLKKPQRYIARAARNYAFPDLIWKPVRKIKGQKIIFLTFADGKIYKSDRIVAEAVDSRYFDEVRSKSLKDLSQKFQEKHKVFINKNSRGYGYYIWKPRVILEALRELDDGDILVWSDSGNTVQPCASDVVSRYVEEVNSDPLGILLNKIPYRTGDWTKMNTLKEILKTEGKEHLASTVLNSPSIASCLLFIRKNNFSVGFIEKWGEYGQIYHLIDDSPSVFPNETSFKENRHDQAILNILFQLYGRIMINATDRPDSFFLENREINPFVPTRKR